MNEDPTVCPACGRKTKITPLPIMGTTLYQRQCTNWSCGKTTNLSESEAAAWIAEQEAR